MKKTEEIDSKQSLITSYFFTKPLEKNHTSRINRCIKCGCDMGDQNPRQLCGKWKCYNIQSPSPSPSPKNDKHKTP